jgi:1-acyl-sn-glycerol-3-phosphate acyltransferase
LSVTELSEKTPSPSPSAQVNPLHAAWRLWRVALLVLQGWAMIRWRFSRLSAPQRQQEVQAWSKRVLTAMGIAWASEGHPPTEGPLLIVANHISWLDILVMNAAAPAHFVSKADVKHWPVLGLLISGAGTLFIERESRRDAMRVVHHMAEQLQAGDILAVFPEGTTSDGTDLLPFHANLFQSAIAVQAPVLPVALMYRDATTRQRSNAPVYIGDTTLFASVWQTLRSRGLVAQVCYGKIQEANGQDRRAWAAQTRQYVAELIANADQAAAHTVTNQRG